MLFDFGNEKIEITHEEPKDNWKTIELDFSEEELNKIKIIEQKLNEYQLTINDFFVALLKNEIQKYNN